MKGLTMKHILLATTGESPQVVTETLYALHKDGHPWPDEIFLITTSRGEKKAHEGLLEQGHLARLCDEIGKPKPTFDTGHILVVPNANGQPVDDARSLEDHEALANFIMTQVRNLTADDQQTVHASLAGGRKTMTFYLGYAMSLFGRFNDRLSHVLISPGYEGNPKFWFKTSSAEHRHLEDRNGNALDADDADVTLALIPFVRHRQSLPEVMRQSGTKVNFANLVRLINLGDQPAAIKLRLDLTNKKIILSDVDSPISETFEPGLLALAFYAMMARATLNGEKELTRPSKKRAHTGLLKDFLDELLPICGLPICSDWKQGLAQLADWNELKCEIKDSTLDALTEGVTDTWFDQRKGELRKLFEKKLPSNLCDRIALEIIWSENGTLLEEPGSIKGGGYGIPLAVENIEIIDCATN
jgi:CRISPR-associated protein (TIGR02584 family)